MLKTFRNTFLLILLFGFSASAQCFTIESILADACGEPEGENEMVTLRVNTNLDINNLSFNWPNNNFLGWCSAPTITNQLNQTIISSCGFLVEPPGGIVPAGANLLVVSSSNVLINANSFEGLSDTLYIIYQCAGNTAGHFSNGANSPRTLQVSYVGNCIGDQTVSYIPTNLPGGDGGAIYYDTLGNGTYYNTGCNAPFPGLNPFWTFPEEICEDFGLIDLTTQLAGNATQGGTWSGDIENTNFFNPSGKFGTYAITYTLEDTSSCIDIADSTIVFTVDTVGMGRDTFETCDSIRQFGTLISRDTTIEIRVSSPNPFLCDSIVERFYKINTTNFEVNPNQITLNSGSSFNFELSDPAVPYELWSASDDTCFIPCNENEIAPADEAVYFIRTVDPSSGCEQILTIQVNLNYNSSLNIPTVFTPNQDGRNDVYKLFGSDLAFVEFQIFSRWGELVFEGNTLSDFWDGTFQGRALESQLFLLKIRASGKDGRRFEITEKIKLIR